MGQLPLKVLVKRALDLGGQPRLIFLALGNANLRSVKLAGRRFRRLRGLACCSVGP